MELPSHKRIFRELYNFLTQHYPPYVDANYWKDHVPGEDKAPQSEQDWWAETTSAKASEYSGDPMYADIWCAIILELERRYNSMREIAHEKGEI